MTKSLKISDDLSLPIDAATQTFAFLGRKRSGKTYGAGKMVELLLDASVQVVILDTVGNWYGLRLSADGKSRGFDIPVFGGLRKDVALLPTAGELVADVIAETGTSAILDVSQFSFADRKRFAAAFGERLWTKKKSETHPTPVHLVLEECQLIIPQFVGKDETRMVHIYEEIVRLGGNYGIGVSMISQRPQSVNKEALTQTECVFAFQMNGVPERKTLKDWLTHAGLNVDVVNELPTLAQGTAYVWSPQWLGVMQKVKIAAKQTFDASSTPKVGQKSVRRDPAPLDVASIEGRMKAVVEQAKENDPKALRAEVAKLRAEIVRLQSAKPSATKVEMKTIEKFVLKEGQLARLDQIAGKASNVVQSLATVLTGFSASVDQIQEAARKMGQPAPAARLGSPQAAVATRVAPVAAAPAGPPQAVHKSVHKLPRVSQRVRQPDAGDGDGPRLKAGARRMLQVLAMFSDTRLSQRQLGTLSGFSPSGGTFREYLGSLVNAGLAARGGDAVSITDGGVAFLAGDVPDKPSKRELIEMFKRHLKAGAGRMLELIVSRSPETISKEDLGAQTGFEASGGTFREYFGSLKSNELIEEAEDGQWRAGSAFELARE